METHVLSILLENQAGVLSRVSGLFTRRGYNIESLSVGVTEDPNLSRITVVTVGDATAIAQICKQLEKLVEVQKVTELLPGDSVLRELALIKVQAIAKSRGEVADIVKIFRATIIDVSPSSMTIELTGQQSKVNAFIELLTPYGVIEIVRTGLAAIQRGGVKLEKSD